MTTFVPIKLLNIFSAAQKFFFQINFFFKSILFLLFVEEEIAPKRYTMPNRDRYHLNHTRGINLRF